MTETAEVARAEEDAINLGSLARDCLTAGVERNLILLRLSLIPFEYYRPHHARLAEEALEPLISADRARLYRLPGGDLALAWRGDRVAAEKAVRATLGVLFADPATPLPPLAELARRFVLPRDGTLLEACLGAPELTPAAAPSLPPLDCAALALIERALANADLSRFARRRAVCRRRRPGDFRLAWESRFLSVPELAESLAPGRDLTADPWLFRRLSRTLDRRLLALLSAPGELAQASPFAINVGIESILSASFLAFDAALPSNLRGEIVLELMPAEILNDAPAFLFARNFARGRGYRLALSGVTPALQRALPLPALGLDFLVMRYTPALVMLPPEELAGGCPEPERILLSDVDQPQALLWGERAGFGLFAGRCVRPAP